MDGKFPAAHLRLHPVSWLELLLIRVAETKSDQTWRTLRHELDRLHVGQFTGAAGTVHQRTDITIRQHAILAQLGVDAPPRFLHVDPTAG